ncbi:MAG: radical SAM protein [Promethearchaeota archaeon]
MKIRITNWLRYFKNFLLNTFTERVIPYSAQIEVTLRCNGKCPFCSIHSLPRAYIQNEMTTSQIKQIIDQIAEFGINTLSFTGGEPTLRADLKKLVYHAGKKHDLITGIATNGFLMPKLLKNGDFHGLDYILLSLDYPTAAQHDKIRGLCLFDKVIETIKLARKNSIYPIISTVVMKDNLDQLEKLCLLAQDLECSIELYPCENIIRDYPDECYQVKNIHEFIPNLSEWAKTLKTLRQKYKNVITDPYSIEVIERGGFGGKLGHYQPYLRCHVAETHLFIRFDGFVNFPCKIHPLLSLNLFKYPLSKIFNIEEVIHIIESHDTFNFCDGCRLGCAIVSSMSAKWKTLYAKYLKAALMGQL